MSLEPGTRVWAVQSANGTTVYAYGFGTYLGDFRYPSDDAEIDPEYLQMCVDVIRKMDADEPIIDHQAYAASLVAAGKLTAEAAAQRVAELEAKDAVERARPIEDRARESAIRSLQNPKILLDSGRVVWGCECWWDVAGDDTPGNWAKGRTIVAVDGPHPGPKIPVEAS